MDDSSSTASNVARAIAAAFDWSSPPDTRKAAVAYLESVKSGDIRVLAKTSLLLVRKDWSSEIRLHGFKMLQHLVRFRWDEFSIAERSEFANLTLNLILEMVSPREEWALKSQTAALAAEVVRREGVTLWHELLPSLVSLSNKGPIEAELVAMMLRWLPEDITVHNEDLEGDRRRVLLRGLTESLTEILPLLYKLLEKHFGAALNEYAKQQLDIAKQHAATVTAALNAVNAYVEWAPVPDLAKYGLIHGCGSLLPYNEFRLHACEFFKLVCQRKRPTDATASEFDSAMNTIFQMLMNVSRDFLNRSRSNFHAIDESEFEFVECICESMVALGSSNMQCIIADGTMTSQFLQQMLEYYQHFKIALHFQSLLFWLVVMRESLSKRKAATHIAGDNSAGSNLGFGSGLAEKEKKGVSAFINDDICSAILDVSFQRMLKKNIVVGNSPTAEALELWSNEFDGKSDFSQYRSRLLELIRLIAFRKPLVAAGRVSHRIDSVIRNFVHASMSAQELVVVESMQLGLETVVGAIFDGSAEFVSSAPETKFQLHSTLEGLLQQLLSLKWTEPTLAVTLGRYLDAFGPYLKYYPDSVAGVVNKLFELLTSLPLAIKDPSSNNARHARLQICTSFIRIARAADKSLLPHMKGIADMMAYLQGKGQLLRGENNLLGEAFLVMASSAGIQQHQEVLAWLLEPLSKQWTSLEWQNAYLSDPFGLPRLCSDTQFMWSIFHTVTCFEKALKRSGTKKAMMNLQGCSTPTDISTYPHPMSRHLSWMLPPLLRLLRSVHALWSQPIAQALTGELRAAKSMSHVEQATLLGESNIKPPKGQLSFADGSQMDMNREGESNENDIRNWLKGIRDSGYNVIGLSATIGDAFFRCVESPSVALALMENVQSMEFRHIRQLIHLVIIPLVKFCPADLWGTWLENLLHPLFLNCEQALTCSWSCLLHEGRAKVPDTFGNLSGLELMVEVMEEKLLRDLTREICSLLSVLASPGLNSGLPSLEQLGPANRLEVSSLRDLDAFVSNSMIGFLIMHKGLALPAMRISIEVFAWTDGEAVNKVIPFCGSLILLAISTNNVELREFVAKDLFYAIIQGLALESNAIISADLVGLCREIYVYLADRDPAPRQILLSLPCIKREDLLAFEDALTKTSSPKEQKQHMRSLLLIATGNKLKALAAQKSTNVITNVTAKTHSSAAGPSVEEDNVIGLAAIT
ncbi:protein HASTY 1 [Phoenix dactylifera]|uniref:Protein HASTY 1 n=1 Tax=Phoenix dactylifera TaxID=42345 RepID=A0A8B7CHV8_PHODC|nr:protein HASTY 1 [Phoenix dactylifera]